MSNVVAGIAQKKVVGSSAKKAVLMLMAACASDDGTGVWASKANMARDLEMSKRTVHAAIQAFVEMGLISEVGKRPAKNGFTYVYDINLDVLEGLPCTRAADAPVQQMHPTRAADAPQDVQQMHPNHPRTEEEPKAPPKVPQGNFDEFWSECPKKVGKGKARSAYAKALKRAPPEIILSGIRRYAQERAGQDQTYTAHPASWLNADRWEDEPQQERRHGNDGAAAERAHRAGERYAERQRARGVDFGQDRNPSVPLLSAGQSGGSG